MKRVAIAVVMLLALSACGDNDDRNVNPGASKANTVASMSPDPLAAYVRKRGPDLDRALTLLVPAAGAPNGKQAREAMIHALAAGPNVPIYEPAAEALQVVGKPAIGSLQDTLQGGEDMWLIRYAVIMLGRMADPDDAETVRLLRTIRQRHRSTGIHIDSAVDEAPILIKARRK